MINGWFFTTTIALRFFLRRWMIFFFFILSRSFFLRRFLLFFVNRNLLFWWSFSFSLPWCLNILFFTLLLSWTLVHFNILKFLRSYFGLSPSHDSIHFFNFFIFFIIFTALSRNSVLTIFASFANTQLSASYSTLVTFTIFLLTTWLFAMTSFSMKALLLSNLRLKGIWVSIKNSIDG